MPRLSDNKLELVAQFLFAGKDAYDASRGAGYPDDASSFAANARKRANRKDVKARVGELQDRAARAAEVDKTFVLLELRNLLEFNIDDYLTAVDIDPDGNLIARRVAIETCSRAQLGRINELQQEVVRLGGKKKSPITAIRTKLRGFDKVAIIAQLAKTAGLDRNETAGALTGLGDKLDAAVKRFAEARRAGAGQP